MALNHPGSSFSASCHMKAGTTGASLPPSCMYLPPKTQPSVRRGSKPQGTPPPLGISWAESGNKGSGMDARERIQTGRKAPEQKHTMGRGGRKKTIRRMARGKNRQQEEWENGRETTIADGQERSNREKPEGFQRWTKGRPWCRKKM